DDDVALAPIDVLGVVAPAGLAAAGGVDRLAIDARRGARTRGLLLGPHLAAQGVVDPVQGPVVAPGVEVAPGGALGREVAGQIAPLAAGAEGVEDGIDDIPYGGLAGPAAARFGRQVGFDQGPLGIGEVAGVMVYSHAITTPETPQMFTLWDRL